MIYRDVLNIHSVLTIIQNTCRALGTSFIRSDGSPIKAIQREACSVCALSPPRPPRPRPWSFSIFSGNAQCPLYWPGVLLVKPICLN